MPSFYGSSYAGRGQSGTTRPSKIPTYLTFSEIISTSIGIVLQVETLQSHESVKPELAKSYAPP